ncbi:dTDP-4-dehydrorhamnose 3,5-epimerase [Paenibacillus donghaensis]|uniref:dTDP-4-dehydrorhamnose 3,5-epimerase n=1 Tax=Paenibacillus donghaensis TaxID=414771 RepID=A0A2Z2KAD2_9BACL|nr:dTDP-4-dehydrorhamnose 3,5-epimerase [Paenibacillus donghaensis]ASA19860.1 dTDP-4-dehydrorhamnose 3,5-epimerase [Paenibacillus donghaensis]
MIIIPKRLEGVFEIQLSSFYDNRGLFMRSYDESIFSEYGIHRKWIQENQSVSLKKGTIRGMHFQYTPFTESKLLRVVSGAVLDVFADLRKDSPTYGQWDSLILSEDNRSMVYIPRGFAHGFCTLCDYCTVQYKVDQVYTPSAEGGIRWDDPSLAIKWPTQTPLLSEKDKNLPTLDLFISQNRGIDSA